MVDEKKDIVLHKRSFADPDKEGVNYYIVDPTADNIRGADWQYSKSYTRSLIEGITTSAEMMDILMRRGVIGPEFEQRQRELSELLSSKILKLQLAANMDDKQMYAMEVANAREELFNWNQRLNGPMSNTCEQMADDAKLEYLTSCIIEKVDGTKLWDSYDSFLKERSQALAVRARFEVMLYLQGLESNFLDHTPEAVAMREVEDELKIKASKALDELSKQQEEEDAKNKYEDEVVKPAKPAKTVKAVKPVKSVKSGTEQTKLVESSEPAKKTSTRKSKATKKD